MHYSILDGTIAITNIVYCNNDQPIALSLGRIDGAADTRAFAPGKSIFRRIRIPLRISDLSRNPPISKALGSDFNTTIGKPLPREELSGINLARRCDIRMADNISNVVT